MSGDALDRLADLCGVAAHYRDAWGQRREVPERTRAAILAVMGHDTSNAAAIDAALHACEDAPWRDPLPPVTVARLGEGAAEVPVVVPASAGGLLRWTVAREDGGTIAGDSALDGMPVAGAREVDGRALVRRSLTLGVDLPLGYHRLSVAFGDDVAAEMPLIVAPERCFLPDAMAAGVRTWGVAVQLYAMRSGRNWGIGDFGDLSRVVEIVAAAGGGTVGLNPLHALFPGRPERCSPYAPSSRLALNPLYIDVEDVAEFAACPGAQAMVAAPSFEAALAALRAARLVDYAGVAARKLPVLAELYRTFRRDHLDLAGGPTERGARFRHFMADDDGTLLRFAAFESLAARFGQDGTANYDWRGWPSGYRDAAGPAVADFVAAQREAVEFHVYLQWLARDQLGGCTARSHDLGMAVGLYGDLAIGAHPDGADAWLLGGLLADGASVGAPPDILNLKGQDWGFAPFRPQALRAAGYAPFAAMLRRSMRAAGALRIDHAIGLQHLYWVPHGLSAADGGYVRQPLDELLAVIALESVRNRCLVIGEDLGTLPEGLQDRLQDAGVLSYRVLPFEWDADGRFRRPQDYPRLALVAAGTHDLPTLPAFWRGDDLRLRARLDLFPSEEAHQAAVAARNLERRRLLEALAEAGIAIGDPPDPYADGIDPPPALIEAVHRFLARTPSLLLLAQIEDLIGEVEPANLPGTSDEYPNWRRRLAPDIDSLAADPRIRSVMAALAAERPASRR